MCSGHGAVNPILSHRLIHIFMFILISTNIAAIWQEAAIDGRREMLSKIIPGLGFGDAYGATIKQVTGQGLDKSRHWRGALMEVTQAERPLMADELYYPLAIELASRDFNATNPHLIATQLGCCPGLISVDKEASTVGLVHFTVKEYFSAPPNIFNSSTWQ